MLSFLQAVETAPQVPMTATSPVPAFTHKDSSPQEVKLQARKQRGTDVLPPCRFLFSVASLPATLTQSLSFYDLKYSPARSAVLLQMVKCLKRVKRSPDPMFSKKSCI